MKILITGSTGLLGQALCAHLASSPDPSAPHQQPVVGRSGFCPTDLPAGLHVTGLSRSATPAAAGLPHVACDLLDARRTAEVIRRLQPQIVFHAQALSDVDRCELEPQAAYASNAQAAANVLAALQQIGGLFVYVSTDYVFDGTKAAPYTEDDPPRPLSVYGRSKLEGERITLASARGIVVRTSTLFGSGRMNFCDHIVTRVRAHQLVEAFVDQVTSPTYTADMAEALVALGTALARSDHPAPHRVYHVANAGGCSRVALAYRVVELVGASRELVRPIRMADQRRPASRPAYSALTSARMPAIIGRTLRPWDAALENYLQQRHSLN